MGTFIRILIVLLALALSPASCASAEPNRLDTLLKELDFQMKTPNTPNRVWTGKFWQFRCIIGNGSHHPIWLQIWDGEEIVYSQIIPAKDDRTLWLGDKRARIYYMFQWKPVGGKRHHWAYKGWTLDSKAAFIANETLIPWLVEDEDVQRYHEETP